MSVELKVKSKHLSAEAQIIRFEERKQLKQANWEKNQYILSGANEVPSNKMYEWFKTYNSLNQHRKWDVRNENRATFLARAYIAGKPYASTEANRKPENEAKFNSYIIPRVVAMVAKYSKEPTSLKAWDKDKKGFVENPALKDVKTKIQEWSKI